MKRRRIITSRGELSEERELLLGKFWILGTSRNFFVSCCIENGLGSKYIQVIIIVWTNRDFFPLLELNLTQKKVETNARRESNFQYKPVYLALNFIIFLFIVS